jgi:hypothetical protein
VVQKQLPRIFRDDEYKAPGPAPSLSLIAHSIIWPGRL